MATNAPSSRKTHIVRIFGTNRKGEVLSHIWADVERMDIVKSAMQIPPDRQWQGVQRKLLWDDDPTKDHYAAEGPASRLIRIMKVCDPQATDDVNDPEEWIPIPVIVGMKSQGGGGEAMGEGFMDRFLNAVLNEELRTDRVAEVRRIVHYDTNIDDQAQAAADADPTLKAYVVASERYTKDESTKDVGQYVEHEIATYLKHEGNTLATSAMGRQTRLLNDYLIDESETATREITGSGGINPPYRLDPFQNIVNVQFKKGSPKYVTVFGHAVSNAAMLFRVDEDTRRVVRVNLGNPLGVTGYPTYGNERVAPSQWFPPAQENFCRAFLDYDGVSQLNGADSGLYTFATLGVSDSTPPPFVATPSPRYVDIFGNSVTGYTTPPPKGVQQNGLWGTSGSVARYNGEVLVWKITNIAPEAILPGGRVLGFNADAAAYGVSTLSPETGSVTGFTAINGGFDAGLMDWDSSSDGMSYLTLNVNDGGGTNHAQFKKVNTQNQTLWTVTLPDVSPLTGASNPASVHSNRTARVLENKKGDVFIVVVDVATEGIIGVGPWNEGATQYASSIRIYDANGVPVQTIAWPGIAYSDYTVEFDRDAPTGSYFFAHGGQSYRVFFDASERFPSV